LLSPTLFESAGVAERGAGVAERGGATLSHSGTLKIFVVTLGSPAFAQNV